MKEYKHTLPIGTKLQSPKRIYTVEQILGQGGFGITYKVSALIRIDNVTIRTFFAVKEFFMKESCERDSHDSVCYSSPVKDKVEESKKDFLAEAQRLNKISLEHPNLIHVNEVFEANNTVYYVMEYLDGGSLRSYVRKHGPLSEHEALEMMKPIFKAVDFLHQNRMTHLDIKPDNIMLKRDADSGKIIPVLIDFGLSKHYDKNGKPTSSIRILGCSDGYAPMEQYVGINTFTPQADVYALAATLLFSLTGKDPAIATELSTKQIVGSLPDTISPKLKDALVAAMKMRKEERTQNACSLLNSLDVQQKNTTNSETVDLNENKTKIKKCNITQGSTIDDVFWWSTLAIVYIPTYILCMLKDWSNWADDWMTQIFRFGFWYVIGTGLIGSIPIYIYDECLNRIFSTIARRVFQFVYIVVLILIEIYVLFYF